MIYVGVVENRDDPLQLGRCQVRVIGLHSEDKTQLPTEKLPWAIPMQPINSASMNGIGWTPTGVVPGSWVVVMFQDTNQQMPIMIGTIGGIPQSQSSIKASIDGHLVSTGRESESEEITQELIDDLNTVLASGDKPIVSVPGVETIIPQKVEPSAQAIAPQAQAVDGQVTRAISSTEQKPIPTKPPAKYFVSSRQETCIKAIISACDLLGLTSKYAKCSILAICGGESNWLPVEEGHFYSRPESLLRIFPGVFKGDYALASKYASWKGAKADFFRFIYSPNFKNGKGAGNRLPDDGALFYGRGFNQITGRALYEQLERELKSLGFNAPISTQPNLLIDNIDISALATVMFYKLNVRANPSSPSYFEAALKRTGGAESGKPKKRLFYQYFLGEAVLPESTNKGSVLANPTYSEDEVRYLPKNKRDALLEDRSINSSTGFLDPVGKYPLRNLLDEPDTNRLARGIIKETAVEFKDSTRTSGIPTANGNDGTWEQPLAPFGGQYPFSKVYESESGHILMFDDSPGNETISLYHRTGTFIDVDANGTQVNKIIGDGYTIIDRNGFIHIAGKCNITIGGGANILVQGDADLEVAGTTTANFLGEVNLGCARDVNWAIGGDLNVKVGGTVKLDSESLYLSSNKTAIQGNNTTLRGDTVGIFSSGSMDIKGNGAVKLNSSSSLALDGSGLQLQAGASLDAKSVDTFDGLTLTPPSGSYASSTKFDVLQTPVRPSPAIIVKTTVVDQVRASLDDFLSNPSAYYNPEAEAGGVNGERPPQPDVGAAGQSLISGAAPTEILEFLRLQVELASEGYWTETGMRGGPSNPNILAMWKDLGMGSIGRSDQVPWCMAWVNWVLKQCNYRYVQTARAFDIRSNPTRWNATRVTGEPLPGDIVVWSYSHVNFVYDVLPNGNITCVGGNQGGGRVSNNNPTGGLVTVSYPNGVSPSNRSIVGIYRPSAQ